MMARPLGDLQLPGLALQQGLDHLQGRGGTQVGGVREVGGLVGAWAEARREGPPMS